MKPFDIVIITAANESQARGYRDQLDWRRRNGLLPEGTLAVTLPDPGGRRVGSLVATVAALRAVAGEAPRADFFAARKVFVCHSGGDSKRTPAYAARGKAFTPVPSHGPGGQPLALFDLILRNAEKLPLESGVLIASGDVVLTFGEGDLASMDLSGCGVTGIGYSDTTEQGSRHGVYVIDPATSAIRDFLQKPSPAVAASAGAVAPDGTVTVDTGLVALSPEACEALMAAAEPPAAPYDLVAAAAAGELAAMDLYEEFLMALLPSLDADAYVARFASRPGFDSAREGVLRAFRERLRNIPFRAVSARACDFFHVGSSRELISGFAGDSLTARLYGFAKGRRQGTDDSLFVFESSCPVEAGGCAYVEGCSCAATLLLDGENVVTGLPEHIGASSIRLPKGIGLVAMPLRSGEWAVVAYGVADDFKTSYSAGAKKPCLFLGRPVEEWLTRSGATEGDLWEGDAASGMWTARLWRSGSVEKALADALMIVDGGLPEGWNEPGRLSMRDLVPLAR